MKLLVTGGAGRVGAATVARLVGGGHAVTVAGRRRGLEVPGAVYRSCDITDEAAIRAEAAGHEAIVHLAALPGPSVGTAAEVFRINATGTFNVYAAAEAAGIGRVVCASSINAFGFNYGRKAFPIARLPVDESLDSFTSDAYSFSKQVTETVAAYFHRRAGIHSVCLRMPWVAPAAETSEERVRSRWRECREAFERLAALPEGERRARAAGLTARWDALRAAGAMELPHPELWKAMPHDPLLMWRSNFWTILDERDAALAVEQGLRARFEGSHVVYVNDDHNLAGIESRSLASLYFPEASCTGLAGTESLVSIARARELIGFAPRYSVERWA